MTTILSKIDKIRTALCSISGLSVDHYFRPFQNAPYCCWAEDSGENLQAENHAAEQKLQGAVDYFTLEEDDPNVDAIQEALNTAEDVGWTLESVQYEDETNLIHYEWRFEVI